MTNEYPEHEKLKALNGKNNDIGDFIEHLHSAGYTICAPHEHVGAMKNRYVAEDRDNGCGNANEDYGETARECGYKKDEMEPVRRNTAEWVALYFNIDQKKLDAEKEAMLESIRSH